MYCAWVGGSWRVFVYLGMPDFFFFWVGCTGYKTPCDGGVIWFKGFERRASCDVMWSNIIETDQKRVSVLGGSINHTHGCFCSVLLLFSSRLPWSLTMPHLSIDKCRSRATQYSARSIHRRWRAWTIWLFPTWERQGRIVEAISSQWSQKMLSTLSLGALSAAIDILTYKYHCTCTCLTDW